MKNKILAPLEWLEVKHPNMQFDFDNDTMFLCESMREYSDYIRNIDAISQMNDTYNQITINKMNDSHKTFLI